MAVGTVRLCRLPAVCCLPTCLPARSPAPMAPPRRRLLHARRGRPTRSAASWGCRRPSGLATRWRTLRATPVGRRGPSRTAPSPSCRARQKALRMAAAGRGAYGHVAGRHSSSSSSSSSSCSTRCPCSSSSSSSSRALPPGDFESESVLPHALLQGLSKVGGCLCIRTVLYAFTSCALVKACTLYFASCAALIL